MRAQRILAVIPGRQDGQTFIFAHRQVAQLRRLGFDVTTFSLLERTNPRGLLQEARRFRAMVQSWSPDVVHAHYGTVTALFAALLSRRPLVISFRGTDLNPSSEHSSLRGAVSRWMSQGAALFAREIICVSPQLRGRLWWRRNRVHVILDGVDPTEFYPIERDEARRRLGWSIGERIVLFNHGAARAPNKRRDLVEGALALLRERLPEVRLVVMEGEVPGDLVPLYVNAADAVVLASDFEGSPNIVKEAIACAVPVCSVDAGDVSELLAGVSASVVVERSAAAIAAGLEPLLRMPQRSNGPYFAERYSTSAHVARVAEILRVAGAARCARSNATVDNVQQ